MDVGRGQSILTLFCFCFLNQNPYYKYCYDLTQPDLICTQRAQPTEIIIQFDASLQACLQFMCCSFFLCPQVSSFFFFFCLKVDGTFSTCLSLYLYMECWEVRNIFRKYYCRGGKKALECLGLKLLHKVCNFVFFVPVMLIPVKSKRMTVCVEDDEELRVDCLIEPKPNKINTYQFSWSIGPRQETINTNVSGESANNLFKDKSRVEELEPVGYRMTLSDFRDKLSDNTTFLCKISGQGENITVQKGKCTGKCACMGGSEAVGMRGRQILRGLCEPTFLLWQIIFSAAQL